MKFNLKLLNGVRTSILEIEGANLIECPNIFIYNLYGQIPHLINENFLNIDLKTFFKQLPLPTLYDAFPRIEKCKETLSDYISNVSRFFFTFYDPCYMKEEYSSKFSIKSSSGIKKLKPNDFMDLQKSLSPSICHIPADVVYNSKASSTRHYKSHKDSMDYIDECLKLRQLYNEEFKPTQYFASSMGGSDPALRTLVAKELATKDLDGYVIDNLAYLSPYTIEHPLFKAPNSISKKRKMFKNGLEDDDNSMSDSDLVLEQDDPKCSLMYSGNYEGRLAELSHLIKASTVGYIAFGQCCHPFSWDILTITRQ